MTRSRETVAFTPADPGVEAASAAMAEPFRGVIRRHVDLLRVASALCRPNS